MKNGKLIVENGERKEPDTLNGQEITQRVKYRTERYQTPSPQQASKVAELETKVTAYLGTMGVCNMSTVFEFQQLVELCRHTHETMQSRAVRSVDLALVVRNWLFGWYIVEFEQDGIDRAQYGKETLKKRVCPTFYTDF